MSNTKDEVDTTILEWHAKGVGLGGISNALEALGLGQWTAEGVRATLKRLGIKADTLRAAEAVFAPDDDYEGGEGWADHCGEKFVRPWLDNTGRDVRDTGCAGEKGDGDVDADSTLADRALEHLERREKADQDNPFGSTG